MDRTIKIVEVGPRDGLQNENTILDLDFKVEFINKLSETGLTNIEVGAFVSDDWVPQMSHSKEIFAKINRRNNINYSALVPNDLGLSRALTARVSSIAVFASASESFCQKNINCSIAESFNRFSSVIKNSLNASIPVRGYISCVLGCPYEGKVDINKVISIAKRLYDLGCYEISLGDTIGVGNITQVRALISKMSSVLPLNKIAVHFHDTYGQALVNVYTAIEMGVNVVDSSVAGLGGCPYATGASGNLATEDLVYMLNGLNLATNIDLDKIIAVGHYIAKKLKIVPRSKVSLTQWQD